MIEQIVSDSPPIKQRLMDMGVLPGVELLVTHVAPLGDPVEIELKRYRLSLRNNEAEMIEVQLME